VKPRTRRRLQLAFTLAGAAATIALLRTEGWTSGTTWQGWAAGAAYCCGLLGGMLT